MIIRKIYGWMYVIYEAGKVAAVLQLLLLPGGVITRKRV